MNINDPIGDLIIRIKNASVRGSPDVRLPWTKIGESVCGVLKDAKYLSDVRVDQIKGIKSIVIKPRYEASGASAITGVKRISKPGVRRYVKFGKIPRVYSGLGISVLSTSLGVVGSKDAIKKHLGGEILFQIW